MAENPEELADDFLSGLSQKMMDVVGDSLGQVISEVDFNQLGKNLTQSITEGIKQTDVPKLLQEKLLNNTKATKVVNDIKKKVEDNLKQMSVGVTLDTTAASKQLQTFSTQQTPITSVTEAAQAAPTVDTSSYENVGNLVKDLVSLTSEANKKTQISVELYNKLYSTAMRLVEAKKLEKKEAEDLIAKYAGKTAGNVEIGINVDKSSIEDLSSTKVELDSKVNVEPVNLAGLVKSFDTLLKTFGKKLEDVFKNADVSKLESKVSSIGSRIATRDLFTVDNDLQGLVEDIASEQERILNLQIASQKVTSQTAEYLQLYAEAQQATEQADRSSLVSQAKKLGIQQAYKQGDDQLRSSIEDQIVKLTKIGDLEKSILTSTIGVKDNINSTDASKLSNELALQLNLTDQSVIQQAAAYALLNQATTGRKELTSEQIQELKLNEEILALFAEQVNASSRLLSARKAVIDIQKEGNLQLETQQLSNQLELISETVKEKARALIEQDKINGGAGILTEQLKAQLKYEDSLITSKQRQVDASSMIGEAQAAIREAIDGTDASKLTQELANQYNIQSAQVKAKMQALVQEKLLRGESGQIGQLEMASLSIIDERIVARDKESAILAKIGEGQANINNLLDELSVDAIIAQLTQQNNITDSTVASQAKYLIQQRVANKQSAELTEQELEQLVAKNKSIVASQQSINLSTKLTETSNTVATALADSAAMAQSMLSPLYTSLGLTQQQTREKAISLIVDAKAKGLSDDLIASKLELLKAEDARLAAQQEQLNIAQDLQAAEDAYAKAMRQAEGDIQIKNLIVRLNLTEDETAQQARLIALKNQEAGVVEDLAKKAGVTVKEIEKQLKANKGLTNLQVQQLKHDNQHLRHKREEVELIEHVAEYQKEINEELEHYTMGWKKTKATISAIFQNPTLAKGVLFASAIQGLHALEHSMHQFMDVGMTAGEGVRATFDTLSIKSLLGISKSKEVHSELVKQYGTANVLSKEQVHTIGEMASAFGLAHDEATNLTMAVSRMPGESKQTATNFSKTAIEIGKAKGVMPSQIMKEMAKNTEKMALYSKGGAIGFAKAAAEAKKMGVELNDMLSAAEKTLDFEQSLTDQMELSAMTGREINLDRLRGLVLAGDTEGVLAEQKRLIQSMGGLDGKDLLTKQKMQQTLGISVENMQKIEESMKNQSDLAGEQSSAWTAITDAGGTMLKYTGAIAGGFGTIAPILMSMSSLMTLMNAQSFPAMIKQIGTFVRGLAAGVVQAGALLLKMITLGKVDLTKSAAGLGPSFGDKRKMVMDRQAAGGGLASRVKTPPAAPGGAGPTDQASKVGKLNANAMLKGAAALLIVAAALFVAAKAFQEFAEVKWEDVAKGLVGIAGLALVAAILGKVQGQMIKGAIAVAILGVALIPFAYAMSLIAGLDINSVLAAAAGLVIFAGAVFGLGALMMTGAGAFFFVAGVAALIALGAALIVLGDGLNAVSAPMQMFAKSLMDLTKGVDGDQLLKVGGGLSLLALGMIGLGYAATVALPAVAALALLGIGLYVVGGALEKIAASLTPVSAALTSISKLNTDQLQKVGDGLLHIAKGLGAIGLSGIAAIPALTALSKLGMLPQQASTTPVAPSSTAKPETRAVAPAPTAIPATAPTAPVAAAPAPAVAQATKPDQTDAKIEALLSRFDALITAFRQKDITLKIDSKVLHKELFDNNLGGKAVTNGIG